MFAPMLCNVIRRVLTVVHASCYPHWYKSYQVEARVAVAAAGAGAGAAAGAAAAAAGAGAAAGDYG